MPAIGTTGDRLKGDNFFDVWEWGGRPGDSSGSVDNALESIRNYILNVRDVNTPGPVSIYFRGSVKPWLLRRPFFVEHSSWEIVGAGREQTTVKGTSQQPCFIFGMPRGSKDRRNVGYTGDPLTLSADHWVDAYGVLDATAVTAAGQRWGLRLKNDAVISCPLTPFSHGMSDGWAQTRQMTVDFCVSPGAGNPLAAGTMLFGMGHPDGTLGGAHPWYFQVNNTTNNLVEFVFRLTGSNQPTANQTIQFSLGAVTGLMRVSFQIDLAAATVQAYVNGKQVAVTSIPATFQAANNMSFEQNYVYPFNVGKLAAMVPWQNSSRVDDLTYFGLCVCKMPMYQNLGVGQPQLYLPAFATGGTPPSYAGQAPTDLTRYFTKQLARVAYFPLTDPPPGNPNCTNDGRVLSILGDTSASTGHGFNISPCGYFLNATTTANPNLTVNNAVRNITVTNGDRLPSGNSGWLGAFGQAIAVCAVYDLTIDNVKATSNGQGIGALNTGSSYTIRLNDVVAQGGDAGYYGFYQIVVARNFTCVYPGRAGIRLKACSAKFTDVWFGDAYMNTEAAVYMHSGEYGGGFIFENVSYDNEGGDGPSIAALVCEGHHYTPTTLRVRDLTIARLGEPAVAIKLVDHSTAPYNNTSGGAAPRFCLVDGFVSWSTTHAANVQTDGTLWCGEVRDFQAAYGAYRFIESVPMISNTGPGGLGRVVSRHRDYSMPPRSGTWAKDCSTFDAQLPAPGQYASWRCTSSGTYGTATPPIWSGSEVQDDGSNALAAYAIDSTYIQPVVLS